MSYERVMSWGVFLVRFSRFLPVGAMVFKEGRVINRKLKTNTDYEMYKMKWLCQI